MQLLPGNDARETNFSWDGLSAELAGATSYQSSNDIISLIKVSQGVSGIGANVQPDITFLRGYMKRYLLRRMIEEGYAILENVDVLGAHPFTYMKYF